MVFHVSKLQDENSNEESLNEKELSEASFSNCSRCPKDLQHPDDEDQKAQDRHMACGESREQEHADGQE